MVVLMKPSVKNQVHIEQLLIIFHLYLFQIHFVHYKARYGSIDVAINHKDGLMVMGFFLEVTHFYVNDRCEPYVVRCAIWYHLCNLKNLKNTHGEVLILVNLQALA